MKIIYKKNKQFRLFKNIKFKIFSNTVSFNVTVSVNWNLICGNVFCDLSVYRMFICRYRLNLLDGLEEKSSGRPAMIRCQRIVL